jgi:hypothetical protein
MAQVIEMKMARASNDDIKKLEDFLEWLENYCEYGTNLNELDENDDPVEIDDEDAMAIIQTEFSRWTRRATVMASWRRIIWGFRVLLDNCTDPDAACLEWKPELKTLIENSESPALEPHPFTADAYQLQESI